MASEVARNQEENGEGLFMEVNSVEKFSIEAGEISQRARVRVRDPNSNPQTTKHHWV